MAFSFKIRKLIEKDRIKFTINLYYEKKYDCNKLVDGEILSRKFNYNSSSVYIITYVDNEIKKFSFVD